MGHCKSLCIDPLLEEIAKRKEEIARRKQIDDMVGNWRYERRSENGEVVPHEYVVYEDTGDLWFVQEVIDSELTKAKLTRYEAYYYAALSHGDLQLVRKDHTMMSKFKAMGEDD